MNTDIKSLSEQLIEQAEWWIAPFSKELHAEIFNIAATMHINKFYPETYKICAEDRSWLCLLEAELQKDEELGHNRNWSEQAYTDTK